MKVKRRDEFGIEPLYYIEKKEGKEFNKSIKPLLSNLNKREIDFTALNHYLAFRCVPEDRTIFQGIKPIPPAHIQINGSFKEYWKPEFRSEHKGEKLLEYMEKAVSKNLKDNQGLFLSGGMDSSTILALHNKLKFGHKLKTFSACFDIKGYDEKREAKETAKYFNTYHTEVELDASCLKKWPLLVYLFEQPMADPTKFPVYYLCRKAAKNCESILVGEGGDENFASYSQYKFMRWHKWMKLVPGWCIKITPKPILNKFFKYISALGEEGINRFINFSRAKTKGEQYQNIVSIFNDKERQELLKDNAENYSPKLKVDTLNEMGWGDVKAIMTEDLMMKMYKNASSFGISGKFPFLDPELFQYTAKLREDIRKDGKWIMKESMKGILPDFIMNRKKARFFVPIHEWGIEKIFDKIVTKEQTKDYFNWEYIERMKRGFEKSKLFYARQMFALIDFIIWKRIFIDEEDYKTIEI